LGEQASLLTSCGVDYLHIDVMDGHFVPAISFGSAIMHSLDPITTAPYDVHLMVEDPEKYIDEFFSFKTRFLTIQAEACTHLDRVLTKINDRGLKAGVALNPATHPQILEYVLDKIDLILVMSVNPGFGGQEFIPSALNKIHYLDELRKKEGYNYKIEVDGGIGPDNAAEILNAGADILVSGSAILGKEEPEDIEKAICDFKKVMEKCECI
jgi:ribulose-phosphate 3-epimerase